MRIGILMLALLVGAAGSGCDSCRGGGSADNRARVPASADPEGGDLVAGAVVAATEKAGGIRLYKIVKINWFPDPVGEELVMIAYQPTATTFEDAAKLWDRGKLTVILPKVRVAKHRFVLRDHRVLAREDVSKRELDAKADDPQRAPGE